MTYIEKVQEFALDMIRMTERNYPKKNRLDYAVGYLDALKHICVFIDGMKQTGRKK